MLFLTLLLGGLLILGWIEHRAHQRELARLRVRIHVNGTRGKSTVTRLIAAGLRASGLRVVAKTTGTEPRLIMQDGAERPVPRRGLPSIAEQAWFVRFASRHKADAVVVECMVVRPDLQWVSEHRMIHATIGVLTNVRLDHSEVMGGSVEEVAHCLCNTLPKNAMLVTAEQDCLSIIQERARRVGCSIVSVNTTDTVSNEEMAGFPRHEFRENVALALEVCRLLGVPRALALEAMQKMQPDPGAFEVIRADWNGFRLNFVNLLACNDVQSVIRILEGQSWLKDGDPVFLLCLRRDRAARSADFLDYLSSGARFRKAVLLGPGARVVSRRLLRRGIPRQSIVARERVTLPQALTLVGSACEEQEEATVVGMGNIVGLGAELAEALRGLRKEAPCPTRF